MVVINHPIHKWLAIDLSLIAVDMDKGYTEHVIIKFISKYTMDLNL